MEGLDTYNITHYPARSRAENISLLRDAVSCQDEDEIESALAAIEDDFHPSILSELDYRENLPEWSKIGKENLKSINHTITWRLLEPGLEHSKDAVPEEIGQIRKHVTENKDFYETVHSESPEVLTVLGENRATLIQRVIEEGALNDCYKDERSSEGERQVRRIRASMSSAEDADRTARVLIARVDNLIRFYRDWYPSRLRADKLFREHPEFPNFPSASDEWRQQEWVSSLRDARDLAHEYRLGLVRDVLDGAAQHLLETGPPDEGGTGDFQHGSGPCARCAMHFTSVGVSCIDPRSPPFNRFGDDILYLPEWLNLATCPFCGKEARIDSPTMFHSFERDQVIYCFPPGFEDFPDEGREKLQPIFESIREHYVERLDAEQVDTFQGASELIAHGWWSFLRAIRMGHLHDEEHLANVVRHEDDSGLLLDSEKGVIIGLTQQEVENGVNQYAGLGNEGSDTELSDTLSAIQRHRLAIQAYKQGEFKKAKSMLEELFEEQPSDPYIRRNLAIVLIEVDEEQRAKSLLSDSEAE